jgi:hypothetical protein
MRKPKSKSSRARMYRALFDMIPAPLIWDLIFEAYLQVIDMVILDYAIANKELRAQFFRGLGCKSPEADDHVIKVGRKSVKSSVPLLFYGMSWLHHHDKSVWLADLNAITWLCTRRLQIYGLRLDIEVLRGPAFVLLKHLDGLQELSVYNCTAEDFDFPKYPSCPSLTSIAFPVNNRAALLRVEECYPKLQRLTGVFDLKIADVMDVFPNLKEFDLDSQILDDYEGISGPYPSIESFIYTNKFHTLFPENLVKLSQAFRNLSQLHL